LLHLVRSSVLLYLFYESYWIEVNCVHKFIFPILYFHLLAIPKSRFAVYFLFHIPRDFVVFPGKGVTPDFAS